MIVLIWKSIVFAQIPFVQIKDEDDIWELYIKDKISGDEYNTLNYLYQHPLDLNKAEISQLQELPEVSLDLAWQIYKHRPFNKTEDIIPIIGQDLFEQIKVFIKVEQLWKGDFNLWLTETQDDNKKADRKTRLSLYTKDMRFGGFSEDEELKKRFILLLNPHPLKKVVIGNYQARFGEGVVFNTAHRQSYCGVVPDDGERKSDIQDGILIETVFDKINSTVFYSWVDLDQFPNSTLSEFDDKEKLWGGNINLVKADTIIGATGYVSNFTSKNGEDKRIEIIGVDFLKRAKETEIAVEIVRSKNQGKGLSLRGYKKISPFKYWLSLRKYEQDFINPHSKVEEGDEQGGEVKIEYDLKDLVLTVFGDYHKHFSTLITDENYWTSIDYKLSPKTIFTTKIEYEDKDISRVGDKKQVYYSELYTKPHIKLDITSGYKYTNHDEKISDYVYTKLNYYFKPQISLTGRFKYGPEGDRETYGQIKIKGQEKELTAKYTHSYPSPHPHNFYVRVKVKW